MAAVWALEMPSSTDKLVLLALADNANDEGECWPSMTTLSVKTCLSDRAVQKSLKRLQEIGAATIKERAGRSNIFIITPERGSPPNVVHPVPGSPHPRTTFTPTPERGSPTPERGSPRIIKEPSFEPSRESYAARAREGNPQEVPRETEALYEAAVTIGNADAHLAVLSIKAKYPKAAREDWLGAEHHLYRIVAAGGNWAEIEAGVERYAKHCKATNRMVQNPGKFFAAVDRPWLQQWAIPDKSGAPKRVPKSIAELELEEAARNAQH